MGLGLSSMVTIWIFVGLGVMVILFLMSGMARLYRKAGPHEALIVYGLGGTRVVQGHGTVIDKLFAVMPEVVRALAAPLANVDKITIVSTGNGDASGMNKVTGDITKMAAQVPALFETLSGMPLSELLGKVRQIGDKAPKPDAPKAGDGPKK